MSKRYWLFIVALGIVSDLSLLPPRDSRAEEQQTYQDIKIEIPFPPYRAAEEPDKNDDPNKPCEQGRDDRNSDLCAQWKAADATKDSAVWTERTFWLGIAGAVVGFLTLAAAAAAAWFAKRAAIATEKTVDEATRMGEMQLRAYMLPRNVTIAYNNGQFFSTGEIFNSGQTPALNVKSWHGIAFEKEFPDEWATEDPIFYSESNVGAGEPISVHAAGPKPPNANNFTAVQTKTMGAWIYGHIVYVDVFGRDHITYYRYDIVVALDGRIFSNLSNKGNSAT